MPVEKTGAQIVIDFLKYHNVDVVFGIPGGATLPIYDELYKANIRHILTRHEQGAIHAAEGYAKASGKIGVCFATSGPGATNLVTGLTDAKLDSVPILAITGQVATNFIGTDAFQEADIYGISTPITKFNKLVKDVDELASSLEEAYFIATSRRPGPVLVDIPKDIQAAKTRKTKYELLLHPKIRERYEKINPHGDIEALAEAINKAEKPLLYIGGGAIISGACDEILKLTETSNIPVTMTLKGLGSFPGNHPYSLGMLGMHGTKYANYAVNHCDLLIALGARFDDRVTGKLASFAQQAKIAHIDIDPAEMGKLVTPDYPIIGDLKKVLQEILTQITSQKREQWISQILKWKESHPLSYDREEDNEIKPQYLLEELNNAIDSEKFILATDVGQHQMWTAQYVQFPRPRTLLTSGGLGTMGFGFPAAIGAKMACPDCQVVTTAGDGSIQMNIQELATVAANNIDVKIIIFNNGVLGMVHQWQDLFFDKRFSHSEIKGIPDFVLLAQAYGLKGMRISQKDEVKPGIDFLLQSQGSAILDVIISDRENVFPMVPAGASLSEMLDFEG